jgi:hypothetical protein
MTSHCPAPLPPPPSSTRCLPLQRKNAVQTRSQVSAQLKQHTCLTAALVCAHYQNSHSCEVGTQTYHLRVMGSVMVGHPCPATLAAPAQEPAQAVPQQL